MKKQAKKDTLEKVSKQQQELLWPSLSYAEWVDTLDTLHMWMQIVGKVKLALSPFLNQWWETVFYVTTTGMTTGRIPYKQRAFSVDFHFIDHYLVVQTSEGLEKTIPLASRTVADFYEAFMNTLTELDIHVVINPLPVEFSSPIPFPTDTIHKSYEKAIVEKWWRLQLQVSFVFDRFRTPFRGKSSPIHFFWGSFDLAGTRFSGKKVSPPGGKGVMGKIMKYAENEENFTFGFWPGDKRFPYPAFYTYLYPAPVGCESMKTGPVFAYFNKQLSECVLPYEEVRKTKNPEKEILSFLTTTYKEYASLAKWAIKELEGQTPSSLK